MEKEVSMMDIMFEPEKYGYKVCGHCNGYGSSLKEESDKCTKCGGRGIIKKEEKEDDK